MVYSAPVPEAGGVSCLLSAPGLNPGRWNARCVDMDKDVQLRPREVGVKGNGSDRKSVV